MGCSQSSGNITNGNLDASLKILHDYVKDKVALKDVYKQFNVMNNNEMDTYEFEFAVFNAIKLSKQVCIIYHISHQLT